MVALAAHNKKREIEKPIFDDGPCVLDMSDVRENASSQLPDE